MGYDVKDDVATMERLAEVHGRGPIDGHVGAEAQDPIFVMGLPRSGTTLVQQILTSHSLVQAAGELQAFPAATMAAVHRQAGPTVGEVEFVVAAWSAERAESGRKMLRGGRDGPA